MVDSNDRRVDEDNNFFGQGLTMQRFMADGEKVPAFGEISLGRIRNMVEEFTLRAKEVLSLFGVRSSEDAQIREDVKSDVTDVLGYQTIGGEVLMTSDSDELEGYVRNLKVLEPDCYEVLVELLVIRGMSDLLIEVVEEISELVPPAQRLFITAIERNKSVSGELKVEVAEFFV